MDKSFAELKEEFLTLGGQETDISGVTEVDDLKDLVELQRHLSQTKEKIKEPRSQLLLTKEQLVGKLNELQAVQTTGLSVEEFAAHNTELVKVRNHLREKLGLAPMARTYTNDDLRVAISLDGGVLGQTCKELMGQFEEHSAESHNLKMQIDAMISEQDLFDEIQGNEARRLQQLESAFDKLKVVPEKYIPKQGVLSSNPAFAVFSDMALSLRRKLLNRKKYYETAEGKFDERSKEALWLKKVTEILIDQQLLEVDYNDE